MPKFSDKEKAFVNLSTRAQLYVNLNEADTPQKKFSCYIKFAITIANQKSLQRHDQIDDENLNFVMQAIKSLLDLGVNPNLGLTLATAYPKLMKLLLNKGADPNFQSQFQETPLHWIASTLPVFYKKESLLAAELLAFYGADLNLTNTVGLKPIELIRDPLFEMSEELINDIETKFKLATEHPRQPNEIVEDTITEPTNSSLRLNENDYANVTLYQQGKYIELIESDPALTSYLTPWRSSSSSTSSTPLPSQKSSVLITSMISEFKKKLLKTSINNTQKNIVEATLCFMLEAISSTASKPIKTLKIIHTEIDIALAQSNKPDLLTKFTEEEINNLKQKGVWDCILQINKIISQAYHAVASNGTVYYFSYKGVTRSACSEPQGILGLTGNNDATASPITKLALLNYIQELVQAEIKVCAASKIQFWYRGTHAENKALEIITNKETSNLAKNIYKQRKA